MKILLVTDSLADANRLSESIEQNQKSDLCHVRKVSEILKALNQENFDVMLLDLSGAADSALANLIYLKQKAPQLPIVVLTDSHNPHLAVQALAHGAQDSLSKQELVPAMLQRSLQYAIARHHNDFNNLQQARMKQMLDRIRNSLDLAAILRTTASVIQEFLQTDQVLVYRCESGQSEESTGVSAPADGIMAQFSINQFINAVNFSSLRSILSESTSVRAVADTWSRSASEIKVIEPDLVRSYLILPIWMEQSVCLDYDDLTLPSERSTISQNRDEGLWGMLVAYNARQIRKWQAWEINFLQRLTTQVTIAIAQSELCCQLKLANQKLQQLAILDGLTGIANRRYFDLVLDKEWQRLAREQQPLSLILFDIDYFKAYNDTYGHQQGDFCLQKVAQILQQATRRPADLAARYGGEEFALILPNTGTQGAQFIAQNIMGGLALQKIPHAKSQVSDFVTVSIGIATKIPDSKQPSHVMIATADSLLYRAKKSGRNQLAITSEKSSISI